MRMMDEDEIDDKIIAIPCEDPTWNFYTDISQLPPHYGNAFAFTQPRSVRRKCSTLKSSLSMAASSASTISQIGRAHV